MEHVLEDELYANKRSRSALQAHREGAGWGKLATDEEGDLPGDRRPVRKRDRVRSHAKVLGHRVETPDLTGMK